MKIESAAILYLAIMFFLAVLFCKTLEILVNWVRTLFVGRNDAIDPVKTELNALNIKIDALQIKFDGKVDVLRTKMDALKAQWVATEQLSVAPDSPMPKLEDAYSNGEDTWIRDVRASEASTAPTIPASPPENTWMRDAVDRETVQRDRPMVLTSTSKDTWPRDIVDNKTVQGGAMGR
jgi:hypothetical protein